MFAKRVKQFIYIGYLMLSTILLGELVFFLFPFLHAKVPPYDTALLDEQLGWRPKSNYQFKGEMLSLNKQSYPIEINTDQRGFRPIHSTEKARRLFIIGDSFTQAVEVSDSKTYSALLGQWLQLDVHAFGMAGYGTLQEYLILQQYLEEIDPSIVLVQFCSNDFIDNEFNLERSANYQVGLRRPYSDATFNISYKTPLSTLEKWMAKTNFLQFCFQKSNRIKDKLGISPANSSENQIARLGHQHPPYQSSLQVTEIILQEIKRLIGPERQLLLFCADAFEPQQSDIASICAKNQIPFIAFPKAQMEAARSQQEVYSIDGFHWNEYGHQIIARTLGNKLSEY